MARKSAGFWSLFFARRVAQLVRAMAHWSEAGRHRMARVVYAISLPLARRRLHIARTNLRLCFPQWSEQAREQVVREQLRLFVQAAVDRALFWFGDPVVYERHIEHVGRAHLEAAVASQRPIIILAPHFVGLDAAGVAITYERELVSMYQRQSNPVFTELTIEGRNRFGTLHLFSRQEGAMKLAKLLKRKIPLYYLPDLDFGGNNAIFSPFFGHPAMTLTALPKLAQLTGALVVPCITRIDKQALARGETRYILTYYPAWDNYPSGSEAEAVRQMNAFIEERIVEDPAQYLWMHKRFKTRPEGEASVYD